MKINIDEPIKTIKISLAQIKKIKPLTEEQAKELDKQIIFAQTEEENGDITIIGLGEAHGEITMSKKRWLFVIGCLLPQILPEFHTCSCSLISSFFSEVQPGDNQSLPVEVFDMKGS